MAVSLHPAMGLFWFLSVLFSRMNICHVTSGTFPKWAVFFAFELSAGVTIPAEAMKLFLA